MENVSLKNIENRWLAAVNPFQIFPEWINDPIRARLIKRRNNIPRFMRVSRGETALQIGTPNPGTMERLSNAVGPRGLVVIIEPAPENIRRLEEARDRLNWPNVDLVRCAAWSESDEMKFSLAAHPGDHKIAIDGIEHDNDYRPENTYEETTTVEAKPLDQIVEKHGLDQVNYVEIMVNGAEMEVLRGATHMLRGFRPIRLLVKGHARTEQGQPLNQEISKFLDRHGLATVVTQGGDPAVGSNPEWRVRDGDVFAYAN